MITHQLQEILYGGVSFHSETVGLSKLPHAIIHRMRPVRHLHLQHAKIDSIAIVLSILSAERYFYITQNIIDLHAVHEIRAVVGGFIVMLMSLDEQRH